MDTLLSVSKKKTEVYEKSCQRILIDTTGI